MNAYDLYAQAMAREQAAYDLAQETGWWEAKVRTAKEAEKALKACLVEFPEKAITHSIIGQTDEDGDVYNTDLDELVSEHFKGQPVEPDSEGGMLCIYCSASMVSEVKKFLKKNAKFESLNSKKNEDANVSGLCNWTEAVRHCMLNDIPYDLELSESEKESLKSSVEEKKEKALKEVTEKYEAMDNKVSKYV